MPDNARLNQLIKTRKMMTKHACLISKDKQRTKELLLLLFKIEILDELMEKIELHQKVRAILKPLFFKNTDKKAA